MSLKWCRTRPNHFVPRKLICWERAKEIEPKPDIVAPSYLVHVHDINRSTLLFFYLLFIFYYFMSYFAVFNAMALPNAFIVFRLWTRSLARQFTNLERVHGVSTTITARKSISQKLNNLFWLCKRRWWMERFHRFTVRAYSFLILSIVARVHWKSIASWKKHKKKRNWITAPCLWHSIQIIIMITKYLKINPKNGKIDEKYDHYKFIALGSCDEPIKSNSVYPCRSGSILVTFIFLRIKIRKRTFLCCRLFLEHGNANFLRVDK